MVIEKKRELGSQKLLLTFEEEGEVTGSCARAEQGQRNCSREDFRERMMLENEIAGHLPFLIRRVNGKKVFEYDIEDYISLEEEAQRKLGFKTIKVLACGLNEVLAGGEPFLLREDDYVVSPGTVFFDKKKGDLKLIHCPGYGQDLKRSLLELIEYCMDEVDYGDEPAVRTTYGMYMKLREGGSLRQLRSVVEDAEPGEQEVRSKGTPASVKEENRRQPAEARKTGFGNLFKRAAEFLSKHRNENGRDTSEDDSETVLMIGSGIQEKLMLVGDSLPGICTDRFPCVVGKDAASCDVVTDAGGVSRRHLRFDRNSEGGVTVEDLNTVNGTFLNGHKLAPNMAFGIREGDEISFGNVSYYVNHIG